MASRQYAANQMGGPLPKLGQKLKGLFKGKGGSKDHPGAVHEECSKDGCNAYATGGGASDVGSRSYTVKTSSSTGGEKNKVMTKKGAAKWGSRIGKVKQNAPAMKNLTKKQKEAQNFVGPPTPSYVKKKK